MVHSTVLYTDRRSLCPLFPLPALPVLELCDTSLNGCFGETGLHGAVLAI